MIRLSAILLGAVMTVAAFAADVTGKWTGKIEFEGDKSMTAKVKSSGGMTGPTITIEFKADKTYKAKQTGGPGGKSMDSEGRWSAAGSTVTLTPMKRDGKAVSGDLAKPKTYTLSKDGKTLSMDISNQVKAQVKDSHGKVGTMPSNFKLKVVLHRS